MSVTLVWKMSCTGVAWSSRWCQPSAPLTRAGQSQASTRESLYKCNCGNITHIIQEIYYTNKIKERLLLDSTLKRRF
jgi:hypothetical protein